MSDYYGYLQGNRSEVTREGTAKSGIRAHLKSWQNDVHVHLGPVNGADYLQVTAPARLPIMVNGVLYKLVDNKIVETQ